MPENPLLPDHKLQELYTLMQRCRALDQKQDRLRRNGRPQARRQTSAGREALLAATSIHLLPGDLLSAEPGDRAAGQLAPAPKAAAAEPANLFPTAASHPLPRLLLCAAAARGLQAAGAEGLVLAFADARSPAAGWAAALEWAQTAQLPLLLACTDTTPPAAAPSRSSSRKSPAPQAATAMDLAAISRLAQRLHLPVLPVDGGDAVAVYRVMQEAALRARMGGGPAVLWALMSPVVPSRTNPLPGPAPHAQLPLARLRSYLTTRHIPLPR